MPNLTSLALYSVRVRNPAERENETLSAILGEDDLLDLFTAYFEKLKEEVPDNEGSQIILRVLKSTVDGRSLRGMIETGAYGIESVLYDRKAKREVYKRTRDIADMLPFFFMFHIPEDTDEGILILQRRSNYGVRNILYDLLSFKFDEEFPDLRLRFKPLILERDMKQLLRGRATQVHYSRYNRSSDIADNVAGGHEEKYGSVELIFKARQGTFFDLSEKLRELMRGESANDVFELEEFDFDFTKVKADLIQPNGRPKRVDLNNWKNLRSYHDVTGRLEEMKKSPNDFEALRLLGDELLHQTLRQIYGRAGDL